MNKIISLTWINHYDIKPDYLSTEEKEKIPKQSSYDAGKKRHSFVLWVFQSKVAGPTFIANSNVYYAIGP